jgi:hypothetical protein
MLNFRNVFLITAIIIISQQTHATDIVPFKTMIPRSQYYLPMIPNGVTNTDKPYAYFLDYTKKPLSQGGILGKTEFEQWNDETERSLDSMLDPSTERAQITSAEIIDNYPIKFDRMRGICFFDNKGTFVHNAPYCGPLDVKNYKEAPGEPHLLRPRSMYSDLKKVTEYTHAISFPFYAGRYPKTILTYKDDGRIEQATTLKHKMVVATQISLATIAAGLVIKKLADKFKW